MNTSNSTGILSPWNSTQVNWIIFVVSVIVFTGLFGNFLVILATLMNSVFKTTANALIINLAVTDILSLCSFGILVFNLRESKWIDEVPWICKLSGFSAMTFSLASALSISCISINRYLYTVHFPAYSSVFGPTKRTMIMLAILWVFAGTFGSLPLLGWSEYQYFPSRGFCFWSVSTSLTFTITYYCLVGPCCLSAIYCYWKIYRTIRKANSPVLALTVSCSTEQSRSTATRKLVQDQTTDLSERKITLSICLVIIFYYATLAPFTIANLLVIWRPGFSISPELDICTTIIAMSNYAVNVFIYSISNRRYRQGIRKIFQRLNNLLCSNETKVKEFSTRKRKTRRQQPKLDVIFVN